MASSPTEPQTKVAFALQEIAACWNQAYEALARGDVDGVADLLDLAGEQLDAAGDGAHDTPAEAALRREAHGAFGRLQAGMKAGMVGIDEELAKSRLGARMLRGYSGADRPRNGWLDRNG